MDRSAVQSSLKITSLRIGISSMKNCTSTIHILVFYVWSINYISLDRELVCTVLVVYCTCPIFIKQLWVFFTVLVLIFIEPKVSLIVNTFSNPAQNPHGVKS